MSITVKRYKEVGKAQYRSRAASDRQTRLGPQLSVHFAFYFSYRLFSLSFAEQMNVYKLLFCVTRIVR